MESDTSTRTRKLLGRLIARALFAFHYIKLSVMPRRP